MCKSIITTLIVLLLIPFGIGQSDDTPKVAPKLGLVLSGGGARGFAHIGLLKVMEEVGLRPDYITGASMGSIVGGLYALGLTAEELEAFAIEQDWGLVLSNKIDLRQINITEKDEYGKNILTLEFNEGELNLPRGLLEGQELSMVLARLACSAHLINDFNEFPIPFKCVSVNLLDGQIVTLDSGYLARAQRASMAIPTIFSPVEFDGKLLVDGGVIRNLPVQEVVDMGADITLGSYTGGKYQKEDDFQSPIDILIGTSFLYSIADSEDQIKLLDHFIDLNCSYSAGDFASAADIIDEGEELAREYIDEIKKLADYMNSFERDPIKPALQYPDSLVLKELNTSTVTPFLEPLVRNSLNLNEGKAYHIKEIEEGIEYVYGTGFFNHVNYSLASDTVGTTINIETKQGATTSLKLGLHYSNADDAALILKGDRRGLFSVPSSLFGQARISTSPAFNGRYMQYIGSKKRFAFQLGTAYQNNAQNFIFAENQSTQKYRRQKFKVFSKLLWIPKNNFMIGTGYRWNRWVMRDDRTTTINLTKLSSNGRTLDLFLNWNVLNKLPFPTKGQNIKFLASYNHSLNYDLSFDSEGENIILDQSLPNDYLKINLFASNYTSLTSALVLFQHFGLGITTKPAVFDNFTLGGDYFTGAQSIPFVGLQEYAAPIDKVASMQFGFRYYFAPKCMIDLKANLAKRLGDTGNAEGADDTVYGLGISASYDFFLGPMTFTIGHSSLTDDIQLAVNMGYRFNYN